MAKKKKRRLKKEVVFVLVFVAILIAIGVGINIYINETKFVFNEQLDQVVLTVNDTNINLRELSYYIIQVEEKGDEYAKIYDEKNPTAYWNMYMQDGNDSGYVSDLAKRTAVNFCVRDNIYAKEAEKAGFELTEDEISDIRYDAEQSYNLMKKRQREQCQLTAEDYEIILTKAQLAYKYMSYLAKDDPDGILQAIVLKYDVGGSYYETLKLQYEITTNETILKNVKVGFITIN